MELIFQAFQLSSTEFGYELKLREALSNIWLMLFQLSLPVQKKDGRPNKSCDQIKLMMIYIHEHYPEKITISNLAAAAYISERECFRVFRDCLHMTPAEYIKTYRLQTACRLLAKGQEPITAVGCSCGLGSSSYFGKTFREYAHCTPSEYRKKWQDYNTKAETEYFFYEGRIIMVPVSLIFCLYLFKGRKSFSAGGKPCIMSQKTL